MEVPCSTDVWITIVQLHMYPQYHKSHALPEHALDRKLYINLEFPLSHISPLGLIKTLSIFYMLICPCLVYGLMLCFFGGKNAWIVQWANNNKNTHDHTASCNPQCENGDCNLIDNTCNCDEQWEGPSCSQGKANNLMVRRYGLIIIIIHSSV